MYPIYKTLDSNLIKLIEFCEYKNRKERGYTGLYVT